jgi:hypothetical protein
MYDTLRRGRFDQDDVTKAKQEFETECSDSTFPAGWPEWRQRAKVAQDCAHRWLFGGSYRCVVCGERAPLRFPA